MPARRPRTPKPTPRPAPEIPPAGPASVLWISNRQRTRRVHARRLREWTAAALEHLHATAELGVHLVGQAEMARVNWEFLQHEGSTDVITFDHGSTADRLHGEVFVSVPDAVLQAQDWSTAWQEELGRYIIHGLLHLQGEDDLAPGPRRRMKQRENRLVRLVAARIPPASLGSEPAPRTSRWTRKPTASRSGSAR